MFFVGAVEECLRDVQQQDDDTGAGAVRMDAAEECACRDFLADVSNSGMYVVCGRHIVKDQEDSGDDLGEEQEQQPRAKNISPLGASGNGLFQGHPQNGTYAGAMV